MNSLSIKEEMMTDDVVTEKIDETTEKITNISKNNSSKKVTGQRSGDKENNQKLELDRGVRDTTSLSGEPKASNEDILLSIGCKIPNGVVITVNDQQILLRGVNDMPDRSALRSYGGIGYTQIKQSVWEQFAQTHQEWLPLKNGFVFVVSANNGR